ncbi:Beta-1,3-N-acetylglucosaminyltransferase lunatic fringe like [Actinidia chinensis var. chinensis]|uniref:Beta-1,3-N-acetylglucosaminyltransferase lunatic fringe like n=1 Tax=Actinidia chinensis var. chinensis TaxID=1590841 RepID=A0A2R6QTF5_ACTCC|nr:Beta-1,3-N-acetylglucosaminyltransferase lunatic fringe like [Actinidia chinensis var. chinensis]
MSSQTHHQRPQTSHHAATLLRRFVTWFFAALLLIYVLYSSNLLRRPSCPLPSAVFYTHAKTDSPTNDSTNYPTDQQQETSPITIPQKSQRYDTELKHIVFCIAASSSLWDHRKEYLKVWWRPKETRAVVWLDQKVRRRRNEALPEIRISGNTARFKYTNGQGQKSALRISRVVSETLRLKMKDVRWFVMGDDDTVFMVENLVRVLSKYDHRQLYYVGSSSESHIQNIFFSYGMAFGGGGFAISYPLARELEKMQDRCIQRYPGLYGSDDRIQACMAELGVPLTKERGFHQYDVYGNLLGILGAHPVTPLVSLHHLDVVDPVFPRMSRVQALQHLFRSSKDDSASMMQQSICYDKLRQWSISVSWGYVVQIIRGVMSPRELEMPTRTFLNWYKRADFTAYAFNTRPVTRHPCQKPFVFYIKSYQNNQGKKQIVGVYVRDRYDPHPFCRWQMNSPEKIDSVVVVKRPDSQRWNKSPRRDCCRVLPSGKRSQMYIWVGNCRDGEVSEL